MYWVTKKLPKKPNKIEPNKIEKIALKSMFPPFQAAAEITIYARKIIRKLENAMYWVAGGFAHIMTLNALQRNLEDIEKPKCFYILVYVVRMNAGLGSDATGFGLIW